MGSLHIPNKHKTSLVLCQRSYGSWLQGNALLLSWTNKLQYAFPPIPLISQVLRRICHDRARVILLAPNWLRQFWYLELLRMCICPPIRSATSQISLFRKGNDLDTPVQTHSTSWHGVWMGIRTGVFLLSTCPSYSYSK